MLWLSSIETLDLALIREFNFNIYGVASLTTRPVLMNEVITKSLRSYYEVIAQNKENTRVSWCCARISFSKGLGCSTQSKMIISYCIVLVQFSESFGLVVLIQQFIRQYLR